MSQEEKMVLETYQSFQQAMIDKDMDQLRKLTRESVIFTHMSGKKQTRDEFFDDIKNGILNYYQSNLLEVRITYEKPYLHLTGMSELKAKVYGITGTWRLPINQYCTKTLRVSPILFMFCLHIFFAVLHMMAFFIYTLIVIFYMKGLNKL